MSYISNRIVKFYYKVWMLYRKVITHNEFDAEGLLLAVLVLMPCATTAFVSTVRPTRSEQLIYDVYRVW